VGDEAARVRMNESRILRGMVAVVRAIKGVSQFPSGADAAMRELEALLRDVESDGPSYEATVLGGLLQEVDRLMEGSAITHTESYQRAKAMERAGRLGRAAATDHKGPELLR
jgi:hypothetical protein